MRLEQFKQIKSDLTKLVNGQFKIILLFILIKLLLKKVF